MILAGLTGMASLRYRDFVLLFGGKAFGWISLHMMMVAIGYIELGEEQWVLINNPWPPGNGDTALITYDYYAEGPYKHWRDYYGIQPATSDTQKGD